ncbi:MAG: oligosaccharide flippase family protein [Bacteroidales bacterium]|nr:oligosaccharide flippase family protein [Bacteroidales bacterium]
MLNAKQIFKSTFYVFSGQLATNILTIGFTIYFAHSFSKDEFATLPIFAVLLAVTNVISNFGLETHCLREIPPLIEKGSRAEVASLFKTVIVNRAFVSTCVGISVFLGSKYIAILFFKDVSYGSVIKIISAGLVFGSLNISFELLGQGVKAFKEIAVIKFATALTYCICATSLYFLFGYKGWAVGFAWSRAMGLLLYLRLFRLWLHPSSNCYPWRKLVKASFPFYLRGYMRFGLLQLDQLIIGVFMSPATLATYYVAKCLSSYISLIIEAVGRPLVVKLAEVKSLGKEAVADGLTKISRCNSFLFVPICFGVAAFGNPLLEIYGGAKYLNAYPILIILCMSSLVTGVWSGVYVRGVFIMGRPIDTLIVDAVGSFVNTVSLLILVTWLGVLGVAMSVFFSAICFVVTAFMILHQKVSLIFDKGALWRSFFATAISVAFAGIMQVVYYDLFLFPVYAFLSVCIFFLIIIRLFQEQDINLLENIFSGKFQIVMRILYFCGMRVVKTKSY